MGKPDRSRGVRPAERPLLSRMATAQSNQVEHRDAEVLRWRFDELCRAGFETEDALIVAADAKIDLHLATKLLRCGCPPQTAMRILL
jgi:hypothetical protein